MPTHARLNPSKASHADEMGTVAVSGGSRAVTSEGADWLVSVEPFLK